MKYILNAEPLKLDSINMERLQLLEEKIRNHFSITQEEASEFLDYLVYTVRKKLDSTMQSAFINQCDTAQSILCTYLNEIGVKNYPNMTQKAILRNVIGHSFVVTKLLVENKDTYYLIDPTFQQFCLEQDCSPKKYLILNSKIILTPNPAYFIRPEEKETMENFLYHGYSKSTPEFAQTYGNCFYNTKTGVEVSSTYNTMPGTVYINSFLKGNETLSKNKKHLLEENRYLGTLNTKIEVEEIKRSR